MSQNMEILARLLAGKSITPLQALYRFGCFRLSARIYDLRRMGYDIKMVIIEENEKRYAKYFLVKKDNIQ